MASEGGHARFSPSSSERWINCPGSIAAQEAVVDKDDSSAASMEGTAAHALLEVCIVLGVQPEGFIGHTLDIGYPKITQKAVNGVNIALDWLAEYVDDYGAENLIVHPERRVHIGPMIGLEAEECNGTSDIIIEHRDRSWLVVGDYKNGVKAVGAKDNPQMKLYTAGAMHEAEGKKFKGVRNVIIQPNAAKKSPVEVVEFRPSSMTPFLKQAAKSAQAAKLPNAPRAAGEWCGFCKARNNCDTFRRRARAVAADEFGEIEDPETISDERLEAVLADAHILQSWIDAVKLRALRLAVAGTKFTHYELGWGPRKKKFEDPEAVADWCRRKGLPVDAYMPRDLLSPAALETMLRTAGLYPRKKRNEEAPPSPIARFISYTVPSPALKKRGAPDATEDFDEVI